MSNDGLGHSLSFARGTWHLNPNHLLFEPLGAGWQSLWARLDPGRLPVDALKLLSGFCAALSAGLFRLTVAPRLADAPRPRFAANHATAWLALSSTFLRLGLSDEIHMIQMPFLVAAAALALRYLERPAFGRALATGAAVGLAGLGFISNLLLGPTLAVGLVVWHFRRREAGLAVQAVAGIGLGSAVVAGVVLGAAWAAFAAPVGFLGWLTHYSGGLQPARVNLAYGIEPTSAGVALAIARALYGTASSLVDVTPLVGALRDGQTPGPWEIGGAVALLAAAIVMLYGLRNTHRGALLLSGAWLAAVLGFGIFWNNSDDQFYFQLAVVYGALAARLPQRRTLLALSGAALLWNLADVGHRWVLYPRQERIALLEQETRGACLVVYPGFDEAAMLLALSHLDPRTDRLPVTDLAVHFPPAGGARVLAERVAGCVRSGGRVVLVDLYDTPPDRNPWKFLRRLGYERAALHAALAPFPVDKTSRRVGPFTVRRIGEDPASVTSSAKIPAWSPADPLPPLAQRSPLSTRHWPAGRPSRLARWPSPRWGERA